MNVMKSWLSKTQSLVLLIIIIYCIFVSIINPNFLSVANLFDVIRSSSWIWILGLGTFIVLLSGGIDLSITSIMIASGYTSAVVIQMTGIENLAFAFAVAIVAGAAFGTINALVIHFFRLPTLIATLGTKTIFIGIMAATVGVEAINTDLLPTVFKNFGLVSIFKVPFGGAEYGLTVFIIPLIILIIITWFVLYRTSVGRGIVALGNSQPATERAGYSLFKIRSFIFMYVGILAGVAGVIAISDVAWIAPLSSTMNGMELTIIAAAIIGGTNLSGGEGTISGMFLGILLVRLFETTLIFLGLDVSWNNFFTGLVLITVLTWTSLQRQRRRRRMLLFEE